MTFSNWLKFTMVIPLKARYFLSNSDYLDINWIPHTIIIFWDNTSSHCNWHHVKLFSFVIAQGISKSGRFFSNENSYNILFSVAYRNLSDASLNLRFLSRVDGQQKGFLQGRKEERGLFKGQVSLRRRSIIMLRACH